MLLPVPTTGMRLRRREHEVVLVGSAFEELLGTQAPHASPEHCDQQEKYDVEHTAEKDQERLAGPLAGQRRRPVP